MPFAMIDLDWLDGSEYHRFLLWIVRNMAGTDGWNGLQAGQVRFSLSKATLDLKLSPWAVRKLIQKSVEDGLISKTLSHGTSNRLGEVYNCLETLRSTRHTKLTQQLTQTSADNKELECDTHTATHTKLTQYNNKTKKTKKDSLSSPKKETLAEILDWDDMDWRGVFFEVFKPFPKEKVMNMFTLAKEFRSAIREGGATPEVIHEAATALCKSRDAQYVPDASRWMKEEGWRAYANR